MPKKENPELLPLADEIYRFTFNEKSMSSRRAPPGALAAQRRYRPKLRDARRFILDDDAVRLISRLSHERDRFDAWAFLARLPHDPMWLEFNLHTKVQELNTLQKHPPPFIPTEVPRRLGFLLYNDDDNVRWVCHEFYDFTNTHAAGMEHRFNYQPGMLDYVFDPEGDLDTVLRGSKVWKTKTLSQLDWFPKIPLRIACPHDGSPLVEGTIDPEICLCGVFDLVEEVAGQRDPKTGVIRAENFLKPPDWFASRAAVTVNAWWGAHLNPEFRNSPEFNAAGDRAGVHKTGNQLIADAVREQQGMMRWIVAMLAAINGLPKDVIPLQPRPGARTVGMNKVPYLGNSQLTLTLPRENHIVWARERLTRTGSELRRRYHDVRGHWRIVERGKRINYVCRHQPALVEAGLGICERCEMVIRWIPPHYRGDAKVGIVERLYNVTAGKDLPEPEGDGEGITDGSHRGPLQSDARDPI